MSKFNDWLGDKLSNILSSMPLFYIIAFLVLSLLIFEKPNSLVEWMHYAIAVFFQGIALPLLGYTSRKAGDIQSKLLNETHDVVMDELASIKLQQGMNQEEIASLKKIISELHQLIKEVHRRTC